MVNSGWNELGLKTKKASRFRLAFFNNGSGGWIRTNDLRVMSPTSYQTALPRIKLVVNRSCSDQRARILRIHYRAVNRYFQTDPAGKALFQQPCPR